MIRPRVHGGAGLAPTASQSTCSAPIRTTTTRSGRTRALALVPPEAGKAATRPANTKIERDDRLGGLIHEYRVAA
jgi:hypothetical protein